MNSKPATAATAVSDTPACVEGVIEVTLARIVLGNHRESSARIISGLHAHGREVATHNPRGEAQSTKPRTSYSADWAPRIVSA